MTATEELESVFMSEGPPKPEGLVDHEIIPPEDFNLHIAKFNGAASLTSMADEYVYYTHGLLLTHGYWYSDPTIDHIKATNGKCMPFGIQLPLPVFKWFDGKDQAGKVVSNVWNQQICVVKKEDWPDLYRFYCLIHGRNNDTKTMSSLIPQKIPIVDTIAMTHTAVLPAAVPTVTCYCFALATNRRTVYFAPDRKANPWDPVPVLTRNPERAMVKYAKAVFSGALKPMSGTLEPTLEQAQAAIEDNESELEPGECKAVSNEELRDKLRKDVYPGLDAEKIELAESWRLAK